MRKELSLAQDRLAASRSEHEQANQDLRATNEELQSINEEYRSTAEELETSKEELQSMNEELQSVNMELKSKLETISGAHNDLKNLMAATEVGTLFLDTDLRIKLFTPEVTRHFNIAESDVGRSISDFTHRLIYDDLEKDARRVLETLAPMETEVGTRDGHWLMMRLRPYRTVDNRIDGVVATMSDITARKRAEDALANELRAIAGHHRFDTRLTEEDAMERLLGSILEAALDLMQAQGGAIHVADPDNRSLRLAVHRGLAAEEQDLLSQVSTEEDSPFALAVRDGRSIIVEDVAAMADADSAAMGAVSRSGARALHCIPLMLDPATPLGLMSVCYGQRTHIGLERRHLADLFAAQAGDALRSFVWQKNLQASEERLRKVLETDAVGVLFFRPAGAVVDANNAFLHMTGFSRRDIIDGRLSWQALTPDEWHAVSLEQLEQMHQTGRIGPYEKEYLRKDGTRRWMLFAGRRLEPDLLVESCIDISDRKRAEEERELLARELSHRVKNSLAVVQALAQQTKGLTMADYRAAFLGRLQALAQAHSLLLNADWRDANLKVLVRNAMAAYQDQAGGRIQISGQPLPLAAKQALGMAMVLHELATNALKYGALSAETGQVVIDWWVKDNAERRLILTWTERGGPPVDPRNEAGFGSTLIERSCTYDLEGECQLDYAPEGLSFSVTVPLVAPAKPQKGEAG